MSDKSDSFSVLLSQINKDSLPGEDCAESVKTKMPTFEEVMSFLVSASSTRFLTMDNVVKHAVCLTIIAALGWPMVRDRRQQMADEAASDVHKDLWRGRSDLLGCEEAEGAEARWEHIQNYDLEEYYADQSDRAFAEKIEQFEQLLAASHRKLLLRRVFARMDVDKSGSVSLEE